MPGARSLQASGVVAVVDGLLWILHAGVGRSDPVYWQPTSGADYLAVALFSAALLGLLPPLLTLHLQQRGHSGRVGAWAFAAAFLGAAAAGIGNLLEDWFGIRLIGLVLYLPGSLLLSVGLVRLGVAPIKAKVVPRWCGWALIVGLLGFLVVSVGGGFVLGLVWGALGVFFLTLTRSNGRLSHHAPS